MGVRVLGLTHGELFLVAFVFLAVVLAPYSGRAGVWVTSLVVKPRQPRG